MPHSLLPHPLIPLACWLTPYWRTSLVIGVVLIAMASTALAVPLYRVQTTSTTASYLFGTLHSDDPRVLAVADRIGCLVDSVDIVAVEIVPDALVLAAVSVATLLPKEQRLADVVGDARWSQLQRMAEQKGLPTAFIDRLKPWAAAVTLGLPMPEGAVLDTLIARMASDSGRRVVGLESAAEQVAVFDQMPLVLQLELIDETIKNGEEMPKALEALTAAYLEGDLAHLEELASSQYTGASKALTVWFEQSLLQSRNAVMAQRAVELLAENSALIAVGALHLGGETGLVAGLRQAGFDVEAVGLETVLAGMACAR